MVIYPYCTVLYMYTVLYTTTRTRTIIKNTVYVLYERREREREAKVAKLEGEGVHEGRGNGAAREEESREQKRREKGAKIEQEAHVENLSQQRWRRRRSG